MSAPNRPPYASEQDLPSDPHPPVGPSPCEHCGEHNPNPLPKHRLASTDSASGVAPAAASSSSASSSTGEQTKKQGKPILDTLLKKNAQWSQDVSSVDKFFFKTSALVQAPKVLWLGCCDSRVPETTLVAARPGDIFVHRNIANQFHPEDDSAQAALAYAVEAARVQHVLVVGHTVCGGCKAAWEASSEDAKNRSTPLSRFLAPLIALRHDLPTDQGSEETMQDLVEANVRRAVEAIAATETVRNNWAQKGADGVQVHGLCYHLETGRLHNLHISIHPPTDAQAAKETLSALLEELKIPEQKEDITTTAAVTKGKAPAV